MTSIESKLQALRELGEKANKGPVEFHSNALVGWWEIWSGPLLLAARPPWENRAAESVATGELFASSLTALPKLVEFAEGVRERHKPEHRYNGTSAMDCCCKVEVLDEDCRWPRCAGCQLTYPCPDIEALSRLGEGL